MARSCSRMVRRTVTSSASPSKLTPQKAENPMGAAKGISTGIEKLLHQQKTVEKQSVQLSKQWKELRNRIDSVLLSTNVLKTTEVRAKCLALDQMTNEQRAVYITENWGPMCLQRVEPLLQQLATIEQALLRSS